jgi:hypothetical protein
LLPVKAWFDRLSVAPELDPADKHRGELGCLLLVPRWFWLGFVMIFELFRIGLDFGVSIFQSILCFKAV